MNANEQIRRRWLMNEAGFQHLVFSLALQYPQPDTLRLAADVLLRWKHLAEESETLIAGFVRSTKDLKIKETATKLARRRSDLSQLINLQPPDGGEKAAAHANAITLALEDVERLEVKLAGLSREYREHRASRSVDWEQARSRLPKGSALLSLRAFQPVDFATGDSGEPHWLALLIPEDPGDEPEILLEDLGPTEPTVRTRRNLRKTVSKKPASKSGCLPAVPSSNPPRETGDKEETSGKKLARQFYQMLFGKLDAELAKYDRLYIAADGALDLVPFVRLILPDGRYWIERQELHQIQTGRDLVKAGSDSVSAAGGMVVYGGVDYAACPEPKPLSAAKQPGGSPVEAEWWTKARYWP